MNREEAEAFSTIFEQFIAGATIMDRLTGTTKWEEVDELTFNPDWEYKVKEWWNVEYWMVGDWPRKFEDRYKAIAARSQYRSISCVKELPTLYRVIVNNEYHHKMVFKEG